MKFIKNALLLFLVLTICFNCTNEENKNTSPLISQVDTISPQIISAPPLQLLDEEQQQDDVDRSKKKMDQPSAQTPDKKESTDYSANSLLIDDISKLLSAQMETYQINPTKDTLITCQKGTVVFLPANSLELPNGESPKNSVELKIKECYEVSEFIGDNLTTLTTKGELLESGGMVNISAWSEGDELKMKKGSEFALYFPKKSKENNMQLFYGNQGVNGVVDWKVGSNPENSKLENSKAESVKLRSSNLQSPDSKLSFYVIENSNANCKPYISGRTTKINQSEVKWELKNENTTVKNYFSQNFSPTDKILSDFCSRRLEVELDICFGNDGKVNDLRFKKKSFKEFDSLVSSFFYSLPAINIATMGNHSPNQFYWLKITTDWVSWESYSTEDAEKIEKKYASFKDQAITKIDQSELNYYVLAASSFGWINCDRFYQSLEKKVDYVVNVKDKIGDMKIVIVFKEMNSIMQGYQQDGHTKFANIPISQPIKIIGISYENEKPMLAIAETITSEQGFELTDFKEFTLDELKGQLGN